MFAPLSTSMRAISVWNPTIAYWSAVLPTYINRALSISTMWGRLSLGWSLLIYLFTLSIAKTGVSGGRERVEEGYRQLIRTMGWEWAWISKSLTSLFDVLISSLPSGVDVKRSTPSVSFSKASCHRGFDDDMKFTSCLYEGPVDLRFLRYPLLKWCRIVDGLTPPPSLCLSHWFLHSI